MYKPICNRNVIDSRVGGWPFDQMFSIPHRWSNTQLLSFEPNFHLPSTSDVRSVTLAAFRRPAGRFRPIFSSLSRRDRPPFLDFALWRKRRKEKRKNFNEKEGMNNKTINYCQKQKKKQFVLGEKLFSPEYGSGHCSENTTRMNDRVIRECFLVSITWNRFGNWRYYVVFPKYTRQWSKKWTIFTFYHTTHQKIYFFMTALFKIFFLSLLIVFPNQFRVEIFNSSLNVKSFHLISKIVDKISWIS